MKMNVTRTFIAAALLTYAFAALGDRPETPPPGMGKYVIVLWSPGTPVPGDPEKRMPDVPEPDIAKLGGRLLDRIANRRVVYLPFAAAKQLQRHEAVASVQRIWVGESLDDWNEQAEFAAEPKVGTDADTDLQWGPKSYSYDGSGNIKKIGTDEYTYDSAGRLIKAKVNGKTETYRYDAFGNLAEKAVSGSNPVQIAIDPGSNRLIGPEYDAAGNVTTRDGRARYTYDSLNMLSHYEGASDRRILYDADDERIGTIIDSLSRWTIRDLDGQIMREYRGDDLGMTMLWFWEQDHIRGEGQLLGGETQQWGYNRGYATSTAYVRFGGERHYHLDHLGSVRMVTDKQGRSLSEHDYYPFGTTQTKTYQEPINWGDPHIDGMRFAGHWRDYLGYLAVEGNDYLDYMHARYYDPAIGRFLSVDPILGTPKRPQSWNRYSYVQNNPVSATDPTGMKMDCVWKADGSLECTFIPDDPFGDSVRLFENWVLERDEERLTYGPDDYQTLQMSRTRGVEAIRQAYKDRGCTSSTADERLYPESEGTFDAAIETLFDGNYLFNTTQAQVGGFSARVDNLGDGRTMYTVANALTVNSFFYHIPNAVGLRGLGTKSRGGTIPFMGRVTQTFRWTEKTPEYCP